jgi:hypothetical protein
LAVVVARGEVDATKTGPAAGDIEILARSPYPRPRPGDRSEPVVLATVIPFDVCRVTAEIY